MAKSLLGRGIKAISISQGQFQFACAYGGGAGQVLLEDGIIRLVSFDPEQELIVQWIP